MSVFSAEIGNNKIRYVKFGEGSKNFVIIPGLSLTSVMNSAAAIESAYSIFSKDYTVYLFDRAEQVSDNPTIKEFADDIVKAMDVIGLENAYFAGFSQGGMIAQQIALDYPEKVIKMVVGSSASRLCDKAKANIEKWIKLADEDTPVSLNRSFFELVYSQAFLDAVGSETVAFLEQQGTKEDMEKFKKVASACLTFDAYERLNDIKCDTLVIAGGEDKVLTADASCEMAKKIGCEIFVYENGSHASYDEAPDYKEKMKNFFEK